MRNFLIVILVLFSSGPVSSTESEEKLFSELEAMREQVLLAPIDARTRLKNMDYELIKSDSNLHVLWLLRMADANNNSYRFADFEVNVAQGLALTNGRTSAKIHAQFLVHYGVIKHRKGDYRTAIEVLKQAADLAVAENERFVYVNALIEMAYALALGEQYEAALVELQKAYLEASYANFVVLVGLAEDIYGAMYAYMEKPEESVKHYQKARQLFIELGYPFYVGESTYGLATTYRYAQDWTQAIKWFGRYKQAVRHLDSNYTQFFYRYGLGMTYSDKGDCESALPIISDALKLTDFKDYNAELHKNRAVCQAKQGDFLAAKKSIANARNIYREIPELRGTTWELEVDKVAGQVAAMSGEFEQAYQLLDNYYINYLKVQKQNTSERLEKLKLTLQSEREQLELANLENENQVQSLKLKNQLRKIEIQSLWIYGSILFFSIIITVVLWQLRVSRKLKALSITDELTGLSNRRFLFASINQLLSSPLSKKVHHSLMLIDVDELKPINDKYGHQDGDKVLKMVADVGRSVLRDGDVFARIGGDEYMLLLTRTNQSLEMAIANRIIKRISQTPVIAQSGDIINVSVSIGVTSIQDLNTSPETIYSRVDQALYRAKSSGRNQVRHW